MILGLLILTVLGGGGVLVPRHHGRAEDQDGDGRGTGRRRRRRPPVKNRLRLLRKRTALSNSIRSRPISPIRRKHWVRLEIALMFRRQAGRAAGGSHPSGYPRLCVRTVSLQQIEGRAASNIFGMTFRNVLTFARKGGYRKKLCSELS